MQRVAPGVAVGMLVRRDVQMRQIGEGGTAKLDIYPAAADGDGQAIGNLQPPQAGTIAPSSNSAPIESVVSPLYIHASVAELSRTRLTDGLHLGRFSTRSNQSGRAYSVPHGRGYAEGQRGPHPGWRDAPQEQGARLP